MIISKQNRRTIYMALFQEGVLVAPKNFEIKHPNFCLLYTSDAADDCSIV